jgi:LysM repeat protein
MKIKDLTLAILIAAVLVMLAGCNRPVAGPTAVESPTSAFKLGTPFITPVFEVTPTPVQALPQATPASIPQVTEVLPTPQILPTAAPVVIQPTPLPPTPSQPAAAVPQAQPALPAAPYVSLAAIPDFYTLQPGEFPYCIARRFNINPNELLAINGLYSSWVSPYNQVYYAGQVFRLPKSGLPFPLPRALRPHPAVYVVQWGDTINKIACFFGDVDPLAIAQANGLQPPYMVYPGQALNIPGPAGTDQPAMLPAPGLGGALAPIPVPASQYPVIPITPFP